jgi:hypothetical protein
MLKKRQHVVKGGYLFAGEPTFSTSRVRFRDPSIWLTTQSTSSMASSQITNVAGEFALRSQNKRHSRTVKKPFLLPFRVLSQVSSALMSRESFPWLDVAKRLAGCRDCHHNMKDWLYACRSLISGMREYFRPQFIQCVMARGRPVADSLQASP